MAPYILAIDQGTTSSRALVFDRNLEIKGLGQREFTQHFPDNGWVEHDANEIWSTTLASCRQAFTKANITARDIACIGITNQRETTVVWDRSTGEPIANAIVWQDRRTSNFCAELRARGMEPMVQDKTGLLLDSYFSASKLRWLLDHVPGARNRANRGELAFGTIDTFLLWRLSNGQSHCTDATNASRTMLFNIHTQEWDHELLDLFDIPDSMLPQVKDCAADFGTTDPAWFDGSIPITGMIGDQQAAAFGQCCFSSGMAKSTYGTGCFLLLNTGNKALRSTKGLLTTIAWRLQGMASYAIEGSIFMAGATMQWLRDGIHLIDNVADSMALARATSPDSSVYLVPAFTGLGAPYWDPDARGAIFGMTRDTGVKEIVTAALMSVCYQTKDLIVAIQQDGTALTQLRIDGGMARNDFVMQRLADVLDCEVLRPEITETTALGAASLAALQAGLFGSLEEISQHWRLQQSFKPTCDANWRQQRYALWLDAVERTRVR